MSISTSAKKLPPAYSDGLLLKINIHKNKEVRYVNDGSSNLSAVNRNRNKGNRINNTKLEK
jgi:hypothetical protein